MNVAYACNEAYMEQTAVSIVSLLENNRDIDEIVIYFIDMGSTVESKQKLRDMICSYKRVLKVIPFNEIAYDINITDTGRHIASVYAKIFFGRITDADRILYIDSDTVIVDCLADFYNMDLENSYCAAVETIHTNKDNDILGIPREIRAINDGVVLMNLDLWRKDDVLQKCQEFINKWNGKPPVLSEGTINAVCRGKINIVNPRYNLSSGFIGVSSRRITGVSGRPFYSEDELKYANEHPVIIHYLSGYYNRPWCEDCTHPLKDEYLKYKQLTAWKDVPLKKNKLPLRIKIMGIFSKYAPDFLYISVYKLFGKK